SPVVHLRLQSLRWLERQYTAGRDLDLVAGLRVAPLARRLLPQLEVTEPDDLDVAPLLERPDHAVEHGLDDRGRLPLRQPVPRNRVDEVVLRQPSHPPSPPRSRPRLSAPGPRRPRRPSSSGTREPRRPRPPSETTPRARRGR